MTRLVRKVDLLSRDGEFVAEIRVLPLTPPPDMVQWGYRHFMFDQTQTDRRGKDTYREGLCIVALPQGVQPATFLVDCDPGDEDSVVPCVHCEGTGGMTSFPCPDCNGTGRDRSND